MKLKNIILTIAALCCGILPATAEDFTYDYTDGTLYYSIIKDAENCVEVTKCINPSKHLIIPETVNIDGVEYEVVSLSNHAVKGGCTEYLELPATLRSVGAILLFIQKISNTYRSRIIWNLSEGVLLSDAEVLKVS